MKDKILKLSKRLKNFSLSEISLILEIDENEVSLILADFVSQKQLIKNGNYYCYNRQFSPKGKISNLPLFFHFHSPETIDFIIRGFCDDVSVNKIKNLLGVSKIVIDKFYGYFREMIYNQQKNRLENYFAQNAYIGRERNWFNATVYLYIYDKELFVSDKILKSFNAKTYNESSRLEIKKQYLRSFRKVQNHAYQSKFYLHLSEEIWKYNINFKNRYSLLRYLIKY